MTLTVIPFTHLELEIEWLTFLFLDCTHLSLFDYVDCWERLDFFDTLIRCFKYGGHYNVATLFLEPFLGALLSLVFDLKFVGRLLHAVFF